MKTITIYDNLTIWDYPGGYREVDTGNGESLVQADDGTWESSDRFEWTIPDLFWGWDSAQRWLGSSLLTERPSWSTTFSSRAFPQSIFAPVRSRTALGGAVADIWVDEQGAVLRFVITNQHPETGKHFYIYWNVESLQPELEGRLPPS